jgi:hypothetical protein
MVFQLWRMYALDARRIPFTPLMPHFSSLAGEAYEMLFLAQAVKPRVELPGKSAVSNTNKKNNA